MDCLARHEDAQRLNRQTALQQLLVLGGESVFLFAIAAFIVDVAMEKQWLNDLGKNIYQEIDNI